MMKFQTKLLLSNFALILLLFTAVSGFFNRYLITRLQGTAQQDMQSLANTVSIQFDDTIKAMDFISEHLLADSSTLSAIRTLSNPNRDDIPPNYIRDAKSHIRASIITYPISKNYYRVSFFNGNGDFITSNTSAASIPDGSATLDSFPDIKAIDEARGSFVLIPPHTDPWSIDKPLMTYSLIRSIGGTPTPSYLEVQKLCGDLESIYGTEADAYDRVALVDAHGTLYFSQLSKEQEFFLSDKIAVGFSVSDALEELDEYIVATAYSDYSNIYTITLRSREVMREIVEQVNMITRLALIAVSTVSIIILYIASVRITKPIRQLTAQIQNTDLYNLDYTYLFEVTNDDIKLLSESYKQLLQRLAQSIAREDELRTLQAKAEFNALQAQVNPHFIFNVLNVISYKGMISGDESICTICSNLAGMLRYSTGTNRSLVTIEEELDYVEKYIYLLKSRYQDMIEYTITVDPLLLHQKIPKVILQQLVENSVNHGFVDSSDIMKIDITGFVQAGHWRITVSDNGCGFEGEKLENIQRKFAQLREEAEAASINLNIEIGGMGLLNTYARLLLSFGPQVVVQINNNAEGGASVSIIAPFVDHGKGE